VVLPPPLADYLLAFRSRTDFRNLNLDQAVLCDFIVEGHLGRHLRRMRNLYASHLEALIAGGERYLKGLLRISGVRAGLYTVGFLENGMNSRQAETAVAARGVQAFALDRYTLKRPDPKGLLLGFAAFDETAIRKGLIQLAAALDQKCERCRKRVGMRPGELLADQGFGISRISHSSTRDDLIASGMVEPAPDSLRHVTKHTVPIES
jgi:DNA-binding transcriptional MocR family regulator